MSDHFIPALSLQRLCDSRCAVGVTALIPGVSAPPQTETRPGSGTSVSLTAEEVTPSGPRSGQCVSLPPLTGAAPAALPLGLAASATSDYARFGTTRSERIGLVRASGARTAGPTHSLGVHAHLVSPLSAPVQQPTHVVSLDLTSAVVTLRT